MGKLKKELHLAPHVYTEEFDKCEWVPTRDGYGHGIVELGKKDKNVVVLDADIGASTRSAWFKKEHPDQFFQIGIAEQNMMGMAAGLSWTGKIPFVSTYAVFCPGRSWDQLRISIAYSEANVKVFGAHAGISVGPDGATHQALEDISITRVLPNMIVLSPADSIETKKATIAGYNHKGPVYTRFGREKVPNITTEKTPFEMGKAIVLAEGKDVTIVATGYMVYYALLAHNQLEKEGLDVGIINLHTIKPIDTDTLVKAAKQSGAIVTAEEHQIAGGMGGAVTEVLAENFPVPIKRVGVLDRFGESGKPEELMKEFNVIDTDIVKAVKEVLKMKK